MSEHIVERAIIMAAGIGQRLRPVTLTTPKPLVTVNGVCMIDTIIAALHENEIHEIYVVVGYLKEQFLAALQCVTLDSRRWAATQKALGTGICAKRKSEHLLG